MNNYLTGIFSRGEIWIWTFWMNCNYRRTYRTILFQKFMTPFNKFFLFLDHILIWDANWKVFELNRSIYEEKCCTSPVILVHWGHGGPSHSWLPRPKAPPRYDRNHRLHLLLLLELLALAASKGSSACRAFVYENKSKCAHSTFSNPLIRRYFQNFFNSSCISLLTESNDIL